MSNITFIIGTLPEKYNESEHDGALEQYLDEVARNRFDDVDRVNVGFNYSSNDLMQVWDGGDLLSETPFNMRRAFKVAMS